MCTICTILARGFFVEYALTDIAYYWHPSETTNCVADDRVCRGRQSLLPTTNFMKQKCLGPSTTTNLVEND